MAKKLYVGNLSYDTTQDTIQQLFAEFGEVVSANLIMDRDTGRSKGFAFVEMSDDAAADKAMAALNDKDVDGRKLRVNEARPQTDRPRFDRG